MLNDTIFESVVPNSMTNGFGWWGMDTWYGNQNGNYWSHGGFMNGVRTQLNYYPNDSTGLIILTNSESDYWAIQNELEAYIPLFAVDSMVSQQELKNANVRLFPNPVSLQDRLMIIIDDSFKSFARVQIYNTNGDMVYSCEMTKKTLSLSLSEFSSGMYFISVSVNDETILKKLLLLNLLKVCRL